MSVRFILTDNFQFDEYGLRWMGRDLALVEALVLAPRTLDPERPVAQVPRMFHLEAFVAAVRGQADGQQLEIFSPKP